MISKNRTKLIRSLETKKGREKAGLFVAEGPKVVSDLLHGGFLAEEVLEDIEDIRKVSFLKHPQSVLGIFKMPEEADETSKDYSRTFHEHIEGQLVLALDGVQDPGNLGTIIRIADWFGIDDIFCSHETADCWNPKVVQATMGSIARVKLRDSPWQHVQQYLHLLYGQPSYVQDCFSDSNHGRYQASFYVLRMH